MSSLHVLFLSMDFAKHLENFFVNKIQVQNIIKNKTRANQNTPQFLYFKVEIGMMIGKSNFF